MRILSLMLKPRKTERIKRITILLLHPLACNSFGQQGPDLLRYLWLMADRHAAQRTCSGLVPSSAFTASDAHCSASASVSALKACRARLSRQSVPEVLIAIHEAVTERVLGRTYALQAYPEYRAFSLAPPSSSSRPGLLPSLPLPLPTPPPSSSSLSLSLSLFFSLFRLRVTGLLPWSSLFCV
jgi:hypothetical protein